MTETWTDSAKVQWTLENGPTEWVWIYECDGTSLFKRPMGKYPPWVAANRTFIGHIKSNIHNGGKMSQSKTMLQQISDVAWLVSQGNNKIGLLNKDVQEHYTYISGKELVNFRNAKEVTQHFGNANLFKEQIDQPVTQKEKYYIKGYEVKYEDNPLVLERSHPDYRSDLPLYSKMSNSNVYYAAGYYCIGFDKAWRAAYCPKLSTLEKYGFEGPFRTMADARQRMRELNRIMNNAR
jgi:hypothetical protein